VTRLFDRILAAKQRDPNYVEIGNPELIEKQTRRAVRRQTMQVLVTADWYF